MLERTIASSALSRGERLYAHYDYFGYVIPTSWLLIGLGVAYAHIFAFSWQQSIKVVERWFRETIGTASTGFEIFVALVIVLLAFNAIYVIGHLIHGFAALTLDRVVAKKLLGYPFKLYLRLATSSCTRGRKEILRDHVLSASYRLTCFVVLPPLLLLELTAFIFAARGSVVMRTLLQDHLYAGLVMFALALLHLGIPSRRKATRECQSVRASWNARNPGAELADTAVSWYAAFAHWAWIIALSLGASVLLPIDHLWVLLIPAALNVTLIVAEAAALTDDSSSFRRPCYEWGFRYLKATIMNPYYFAANLTSYGDSPSVDVIADAARLTGVDVNRIDDETAGRDFFWLCSILVQNEGGGSRDSAYHFLSMSGMNRNLCCSTAFVACASALMLICAGRAETTRVWLLGWFAGLATLTAVFLIRFLYLYSSYYSRFLVRAAAVIRRSGAATARSRRPLRERFDAIPYRV